MSAERRAFYNSPEGRAERAVGPDLTAAFEAIFGTHPDDLPPGPPSADDGPDPDPWAADDRALDRRQEDRVAEVFGG